VSNDKLPVSGAIELPAEHPSKHGMGADEVIGAKAPERTRSDDTAEYSDISETDAYRRKAAHQDQIRHV